jgi:hypothetical protein
MQTSLPLAFEQEIACRQNNGKFDESRTLQVEADKCGGQVIEILERSCGIVSARREAPASRKDDAKSDL